MAHNSGKLLNLIYEKEPPSRCKTPKTVSKGGSKVEKVRKVFIRNSIAPAKSSEIIQGKKRVQFAYLEDDLSSDDERADFSLPEFCSILKLADEIRKVQLKPNLDLVKRELEKLPKQFNLNFDPDERIYQDLISVERPVTESQPKVKSSQSSRFSTRKDPEPDYKALLKHTFQPEYKFTRFVVPEVKKPEAEFDGHSIYRLLRRLTVHNTY